MALAGLFFAGCAATLGNTASGNDRGLILNGVITLSPDNATTFYWVLTGISGLFVLAALIGLVRAFGAMQEVVLDAHAITAPKSAFGNALSIVPLSTITDLQIMQIKSQRLLIIRHNAGKLTINRSMLPSHDDFDTLVTAIDERRRAPESR
ncbi:hypothetical protein ACMGDH_00510 [Sphingomonas sp. DT-207]|uniref:hypothetical protein n=1 Tax=Sphingomonas sp. DT-207 TaxID=3396167 RepID=UPI003F1C7797